MCTKLAAVPWYGLIALSGIAAAQNRLAYDSAYADYRPYRDEARLAWREANDEAARIGGHAGIFAAGMPHAHDGAKPPAAPAPAAAPALPAKPPAAHHGHH